TTAVRMDDSVPMNIRRERTKQLRILSSKLQHAFYQRHIGTVRSVLFEYGDTDAPADHILGFTDNYLRVSIPYDPALANTIVPVAIDRIDADGHIAGAINSARTEAVRRRTLTTAN
ncbi:MAG: hypothetical protein ABI373_06025, partial [Flavobacteriales bacterium]